MIGKRFKNKNAFLLFFFFFSGHHPLYGANFNNRGDNIREWTGLEFCKSQRAVEKRENGEDWLQNHLWCLNDLRGFKGLMMMMMMMMIMMN